MKSFLAVFGFLLIVPSAPRSEVARTWELKAAKTTRGIRSNFFVDAVNYGTDSIGLWLASGKGVNFTFDDGASWYLVDASNGLPAVDLSAIHAGNGRLWVATNHDTLIDDELFSSSDALSYTDDDGASWHTINFGSGGLNIRRVTGGPNHTVFDIAGHTDLGFFNNRDADNDADWLFFSAWAAGVLASQDGGDSWRRLFPFAGDSTAFARA